MNQQLIDPLIQPGSLILVTAGNGYIASHIVDQFLTYGYAVRATVRSKERTAWMTREFRSRHPNAQLEVVEIPDLCEPNCYDSVLKGVSAMVHTPYTSFDDAEIVANTVKLNLHALKAVREANLNGEQIKRFVLTGSSWAAKFPTPNVPGDIAEDQYDESVSHALSNPDTPQDTMVLLRYAQSKLVGEQTCWNWVFLHPDCGFVLNTVLPATVMGPAVAPLDQPYPSTGGYPRLLHENKFQDLSDAIPQWFVDARDQARLHVAGAVLDGVEYQRIFAYTAPYTWIEVADVLEKEMGTRTTSRLADKGRDMTNVLAQDKAEGYLKRLGMSGWVPFEKSIREGIRSFYPKTI